MTAVIVGAMMLASSSIALSSPARADTPTDAPETVTWSVEPADEHGPTGEAWTELTLDAGQSVTEHMLVTNRGRGDVVFHLSAADGYFTESGRFNMLPADQASTDAGTWITIQDSIEVGAGQSVLVPFRVAVPANATPGDHPAGVAAGIRTGDSTIGVESRVGFRVMTRVSGDLAPALTVTDQTVAYTPSWNPFLPGSLAVTATIVNSGNTRLGALPRASSSGPLGLFAADTTLAQIPEFAPGESRTVSVAIPDVWPVFVTEARTIVDSVPLDGAEPLPAVSASTQTTLWTIPWSHLLLIAVLALAIVLLRWRGTARRAAVSRMIDDAREEGRRDGALTKTGLLAVLIAVIVAGIVTSEAVPSFASAEPGTVSIDVEVTSRPPDAPGPTTATPTAVPARGDLALTGPTLDPGVALVAGALVAAGAAAIHVSTRHRRAGASARRSRR
ncbi:MAG: hypothetical protein PIR02_12345 [Microbacterium enclense]